MKTPSTARPWPSWAPLRRRDWLLTLALSPVGARAGAAAETVDVLEGEWRDPARARSLPWRAYLPAQGEALPWVVYSHGLGGSRRAGEWWGRHWASQGVASVHVQHPGSDQRLLGQGLPTLWRALNAENLVLRAGDLRFAVDDVLGARRAGRRPWQRLSADRVGVAGHSFGALTALAVAGQRLAPDYGPSPLHDTRLRAGLAFSPSVRRADPARAFAAIDIPFFSITGTRDEVPMLDPVAAPSRTAPYEAMPPGDKYLLVFEDGVHASFAGQEARGPADDAQATARIAPLVMQATTLFWRAHLAGDGEARAGLLDLRTRLGLRPGDRFAHR